MSKYFEEAYTSRQKIIEWFIDYRTYYPDPASISFAQWKKDFLEGEKIEIPNCIEGKAKQEKAYKFVEEVINSIDKSIEEFKKRYDIEGSR